MQYRQLGHSGLRVSTLCLGTMTFGEADETSFMHKVGCDEPTAGRIMDRALDAGVNFFDTADVYGNDGLTEQVIGRWF
ncbi:MAG TPA: aldo/keto reductase, partial [Nannocystis sp.]